MRQLIPTMLLPLISLAPAEEMATFHFDENGTSRPAGWPDQPAKIFAIAEKPLRLHFSGSTADWEPVVRVHRITSARRLPLQADEAQAIADGWQWSWTPPANRGPAHYEVRFANTSSRTVRVETRDPAWLKATLEMLGNHVAWEALGLTADERAALIAHGLDLGHAAVGGKGEIASLLLIPRQSGTGRRRVVWDEEDPNLVIWRPGPAGGDLEVRAPRWWISPKALATDQGLIRFLDLFSEPPRNP